MSDELALDTPQALYWANQWSSVKTSSTKIADDVDTDYYGLGPFAGKDQQGQTFTDAITPGIDGGRQALQAVGECGLNVSGGLAATVAGELAANTRSTELAG
jgi:hypothetical protein